MKADGFAFPKAPSNETLINYVQKKLEVSGIGGSAHKKMAPLIEAMNANHNFKGKLAKPKTVKVLRQPSGDFYASREWRAARYQALKANDGRCELCGASKHTGAVMHVDHILPRSKFPKLQLEPTNLQVLCEDCNLGKSNTDYTDWRARDDAWAATDERMSRIAGFCETTEGV